MRCKTAIVAEGGGQRGIYTAGVLDAFLEQSFNPFDLGIGVSAGAQNLLTYFLEVPDYARRAIMELTSKPDFIVFSRGISGKSICDLDGYFNTSIHDPEYQLPYRRIEQVVQHRRLQVVAADRDTIEPVYLEPDADNIVDCVKASSAVPFLYRPGVSMDERILIDGGVADPLPVKHAYDQGARYIVLVRTVPLFSPDQFDIPWRRRLDRVRHFSFKFTRYSKMLEQHEHAMRVAMDFLRNPPADLKLYVLAPTLPLKSFFFSTSAEHLLEDYHQGVEHGKRSLVELQALFADAGESDHVDLTGRRAQDCVE